MLCYHLFFFYYYGDHRDLHSFPTRRSSDLVLVLSNSGKRSDDNAERLARLGLPANEHEGVLTSGEVLWHGLQERDRKSTRLNSSHSQISYAVFCLKKKNKKECKMKTL